VVVDTQEMVTGYTDRMVVLTCEVYGYLNFNNPTVRWSRETGGTCQPLDLQNHPPKYTVEYSSGSRLAQRPDGTTRQSMVATLTIHQLATVDTGRYICETGWEKEGASTLTVITGSQSTEGTSETGRTSVTGVTSMTSGTSMTEMTEITTMLSGGSTG